MPKTSRVVKTAGLTYEKQYLAYGCRTIVGIDEVGRGAWAGPVAAGAVCLPLTDASLSARLQGVRDSKQMTGRSRARLAETIKTTALAWGIGSASSAEIDTLGIVPATKQAMARALAMITENFPGFAPDCIFTDSVPWPESPIHTRLVSIVRGDQHSLSVAAASVIAKVWRDEFMLRLDTAYPGYGFAVHKGYGTARHQAALKDSGITDIHRVSYAPVRRARKDAPDVDIH